MPTYLQSQPIMDHNGPGTTPPRWACALGVIQAVAGAVLITVRLL
jgi:hypothetical protein